MNPYIYVLAPMLVAIIFNTYIAGLVGFQYATYKSVTFKISWKTKLMVFMLWIIDLFQTILTIYMVWLYCVTDYLDPVAIKRAALWTFTIIPLCNSFSSVITHSFMAHRIYTTAKRSTIIALCLSISAVFALGFIAGVYGLIWDLSMIDVVHGTEHPYRPLLLSWFATRLAVDATLLGSLTSYFIRQGTAFMDDYPLRIVKLGLLAIQCGALTTLFSLLCLVAFASSSKTTAYVVFLLPSGRLYSNVVLTSINAHARRVDPSQNGNHAQAVTKDIWAAHQQTTNVQAFNLTEMRAEGLDTVGEGPLDKLPVSLCSRFSAADGQSKTILDIKS